MAERRRVMGLEGRIDVKRLEMVESVSVEIDAPVINPLDPPKSIKPIVNIPVYLPIPPIQTKPTLTPLQFKPRDYTFQDRIADARAPLSTLQIDTLIHQIQNPKKPQEPLPDIDLQHVPWRDHLPGNRLASIDKSIKEINDALSLL